MTQETMTADQVRAAMAPSRSKYRNKRTRVDGICFDSKKEAEYYEHLKKLRAGGFLQFHRQVMFDLPGGVTYRCDFQVIHHDGRLEYVDVKGMRTAMYRLKKKQVEAIYGVVIREV